MRAPTIKTKLLLELMSDAYVTDWCMEAAAQRRLAANLKRLRDTRKGARNTRNLKMCEMYEKRAKLYLSLNRHIRELAKIHGWAV